MFGSGDSNRNSDFSSYRVDELNKLLMCKYYECITQKQPAPNGYPGWSPNNIRRVIISPDGVCVEYHTTTDMDVRRGKKYAYTAFNTEKAIQCLNNPKSKSLLSVFSDNRVYSALEELVILTSSLNNLCLRGDELDLSGIGIKDRADIKKSLEDRYKRLNHIILVESIDLVTLLNLCYSNQQVYGITSTIYEILQENNIQSKRLKVYGMSAYSNMPNLRGYSRSDGSGYLADIKGENNDKSKSGAVRRHFELVVAQYERERVYKAKKQTAERYNKDEIKEYYRIINFVLGLQDYIEKFFSQKNIREMVMNDLGSFRAITESEDIFVNTLIKSTSNFSKVQKYYIDRAREYISYKEFQDLANEVGVSVVSTNKLHNLLNKENISSKEVKCTEGLKNFTIFLVNGVLAPFCELLANSKNSKIKLYNTIYNKVSEEKFYIPNVDSKENYAFTELSKLFDNTEVVNTGIGTCLVLDLPLILYMYSNLFIDRKKLKLDVNTYDNWKKVIGKLYKSKLEVK